MQTHLLKVDKPKTIIVNKYLKMPCWYYDKKELRETPSIKDSISFETERRYRKEGARFIMTCGTQMGLGHNTMATGVVYFHRFYMQHSFKSFPRYVTACCCLFLAGKVEETPKKCRDIIKTARGLLTDNYFYSFGEDPKEEVMTLERILLQTIKFDLQVEHPYTFLLKYAKCFKGDQQKLQKMVQMAWNFVNDSLSTVVCLQWEPEIIAVALIHLASKLSKFTVVDWIGRQSGHLRWWDMFVADVTMEILEDICHQVLDLYQSNQKESNEPPSPPQKPPSRADSPTNVSRLPLNSNTSSPAGKTTTKASTAQSTTPTNAGNGTTGTTTVATEVNNIQAIKSLANVTPGVPAAAVSNTDQLSQAPPSVNATVPTSSYHVYHAPPPSTHNVYGIAPLTGPPPLPQAPIAPYPLPHAATSWAQGPPPPPHYNTNSVPPLPQQATGIAGATSINNIGNNGNGNGGNGSYYPTPQGAYGSRQRY